MANLSTTGANALPIGDVFVHHSSQVVQAESGLSSIDSTIAPIMPRCSNLPSPTDPPSEVAASEQHRVDAGFQLYSADARTSFHICHVNVNCLINKIDQVLHLLPDFEVDVLGISETWLTSVTTYSSVI